MSKTKYESFLGMSLFRESILDSHLLHIPHSSYHIPIFDGFSIDKIDENLKILTDSSTDKIFDVKGIRKIITPFSRLFCDVERLDDNTEPMYSVGRGICYTHGYDGCEIRKLNDELKKTIYNEYYLKHHQLLNNECKKILENYGVCHIIDCHSFNDKPIIIFNGETKFPDICIGTDEYHTPSYLIDYTINYFKNKGYSVEIDNPYSGCMIPNDFYKKDSRVKGIMIEVNKNLYMDNHSVNMEKVDNLCNVMTNYFYNI
jgi:N-formylglutamate amidohydrolase